MGGCFGSHPIDRWLESQVDAYCGGNEFRREMRAKCIMREKAERDNEKEDKQVVRSEPDRII